MLVSTRLHTLARHFLVIAIAVGLFFLQGPRFLRQPYDHFSDTGDGLLNAWIMAWDTHALLEGGGNVWDMPIFFPVKNTLTYSETMFGNLWLAAPVNYFTGNPILAANLHILACFVLGTYCTFLLVRRLTGSFAGGLAAGVMYAFNPLLWAKLPHMNLLPFYWAPLSLLCCHRFLETRGWKPLSGMVVALVAQYYTSINLGMMLTTMLLCFGGIYCLRERQGWDRLFFVRQPRVLAKLIVVGGVGLLCLWPLGRHYLRTVADWDVARTQADNVSNSSEPLALFVPEWTFASYKAWSDACLGKIRGTAGLGFAPWLLGLTGLVLANRGNSSLTDEQQRVARRFGWMALCVGVLLLGPQLIWFDKPLHVPLPYMLLFHCLPGAQAVRVPSRYVVPLLLCLSVLSGFTVAWLAAHWQGLRPLVKMGLVLALGAWLGLDYAVTETPGVVLPDRAHFPPVYSYLAQGQPDRPILELPAVWAKQFEYHYYQTAYWRPLVLGDSGTVPPWGRETASRLEAGPTEGALRFLRLTPAQTVVLHLDRFPSALAAAWADAPLQRYGFRRAGKFGEAVVWEREEPLLTSSESLRVISHDVTFFRSLWSNRCRAQITVAAAQPGQPWRYLTRGLQKVMVTLTDARGISCSFQRKIKIPPYLLAEETAVLPLGPFDGLTEPVTEIRVEGGMLEE
jgi:hypothetical protein